MGCAMSSDIDRLERALEHQNDQLLLMAQGCYWQALGGAHRVHDIGGMCNEQNEALLEEIRGMLADRRAEPGTLSQSQVRDRACQIIKYQSGHSRSRLLFPM